MNFKEKTDSRKNRSNLMSPCQIQQTCTLAALDVWFSAELAVVTPPERQVITSVYKQLNAFVEWPKSAMLLWNGRDRSEKYHTYPATIKLMALTAKVRLDGRVNGPAVAAYCLAGGNRHARLGSNNRWSVHHIYSGKFPHLGKANTLHAAHDGMHCTQSAGLVAVHPIADQMCDEYPFFSWLLRAIAFQKFNYDPDNVFSSSPHDEYGFVGNPCYIVPSIAPLLSSSK